VNRTDRLYALAVELSASAPRCVPARALAARLGVSVRTVERDVARLRRLGLPVEPRRGEGYRLAEEAGAGGVLPPVVLTAEEAAAVAAALRDVEEDGLAAPARSALRKIAAALSVPEREPAGPPPVARTVERALARGRALRIGYADRTGAVTSRDVEPRILLAGRGSVRYLVAWCRLRDDVRVFRLDRIASAVELDDATAGGAAAQASGR
jgi:predicted DNA-binding transcriptional regulator YafY